MASPPVQPPPRKRLVATPIVLLPLAAALGALVLSPLFGQSWRWCVFVGLAALLVAVGLFLTRCLVLSGRRPSPPVPGPSSKPADAASPIPPRPDTEKLRQQFVLSLSEAVEAERQSQRDDVELAGTSTPAAYP